MRSLWDRLTGAADPEREERRRAIEAQHEELKRALREAHRERQTAAFDRLLPGGDHD